ncbi:DedA family protein [Butyricimonas hominis]|uniref:DedA family protein n=1 Tax=Butyricimonas TaxID=574697 RepID=UPI003518CE41
MIDWLQSILDWYMYNVNYWSVLVCMAIESTIIPFPSELIVPPAAWKAANGELNFVLVIVFSTIGAVIGALANYVLACTLGRKFIYSFAESRWGKICGMTKEKIEKSEQYFLKYGKSSTLIGRLTPGVRSLISLPAGLVRMPLKSFILYTAVGSGIWNLILATTGYFLYSRKELLEMYFTEITIAMLVVGCCFFGYLIIKNIRKKTN